MRQVSKSDLRDHVIAQHNIQNRESLVVTIAYTKALETGLKVPMEPENVACSTSKIQLGQQKLKNLVRFIKCTCCTDPYAVK